MKKTVALLLSLIMLLSVCVVPIAAQDTEPAPENSLEDATVKDISGKTITLDGVMGADEGWAEKPYVLLDNLSQSGDARKLSGNTVDSITDDVYEKASEVRISEDGDYLYFFWQSWTEESSTIYFQFGFENVGVQKEGSTLRAASYIIGSENPETYWDGAVDEFYLGGSSSSWITGMNSNGSTGDLNNTEFFYKNSAFYLKKNADGTKSIELRVAIPEDIREKRLTQDIEVAYGSWERIRTDPSTQGLISSEGYDWTLCSNGFTLKSKAQTVNAEVKNVKGTTITLDGAMGDDEKWASIPYLLLDTLTTAEGVDKISDNTVGSSSTDDYETASAIRISEDGEFLYFFFESLTDVSEKIYFNVGFDGAETDGANGDKNLGVRVVIDLDHASGVWDGATETAFWANSYIANKDQLVKGDYFYDNTSFCLKKVGAKTTLELKLPIPVAAQEKRLTSDVVVTYGSLEENAADTTYTHGLVSPNGYGMNAGFDGFVLAQDATISASLNESVNKWIHSTVTDAKYTSLSDLTVNVIGDDYLQGGVLNDSLVWTALMSRKYDWTYASYAKAGSLVSSYNDIDAQPITVRYRSMSNNNPDIVIVNGGYNDYLNSVPLGDLNTTATDTDTFKGALNSMFKNMRRKYPNAMFVYTGLYNFPQAAGNDKTYLDYAAAAEEVCAANGVYFFKAYDPAVSGIDMSSEAFRAEYCVTTDNVCNLNLAGMKLVMGKYEAFLAESAADWAVNKDSILNGNKTEETTTAPIPTETTPVTTPTDTTPVDIGKKGGCGSSVSSACAVMFILIVSFGAVCFTRKKKV